MNKDIWKERRGGRGSKGRKRVKEVIEEQGW